MTMIINNPAFKLAQWACAGVSFNLAQRIMDHYIDGVIDMYPFLEFLK